MSIESHYSKPMQQYHAKYEMYQAYVKKLEKRIQIAQQIRDESYDASDYYLDEGEHDGMSATDSRGLPRNGTLTKLDDVYGLNTKNRERADVIGFAREYFTKNQELLQNFDSFKSFAGKELSPTMYTDNFSVSMHALFNGFDHRNLTESQYEFMDNVLNAYHLEKEEEKANKSIQETVIHQDSSIPRENVMKRLYNLIKLR